MGKGLTGVESRLKKFKKSYLPSYVKLYYNEEAFKEMHGKLISILI